MLPLLNRLLSDFSPHIRLESGAVARSAQVENTPVLDRIIAALPADISETLPDLSVAETRHVAFARWLRDLPQKARARSGLSQQRPPEHLHFVEGLAGLFYDFRNTDIVAQDLAEAGVSLKGRLLDFGCSTGRSLATLQRAYGSRLTLSGCDPAASSIDWARAQFPFATFFTNAQRPPLDLPDNCFDLIIANSIWTHFSPRAAKEWLAELAWILVPGGHLVVSTHGPHDLAYRLAHGFPAPAYERFAGADHWRAEAFIEAAIKGLADKGHFFQPYKAISHQRDLREINAGQTQEWGLAFLMPDYVQDVLTPPHLKMIQHKIGRTGNRHDLYIFQRKKA